MRRILLGIACGLSLVACGSAQTPGAAPGSTTPGSNTPGSPTITPTDDNGCGPVEVCGTATVSGAQTLSTKFFSVLSDLNNRKCSEWAAGADGKLTVPRVSNSERTLIFFADDPIVYTGPDTYSDAELLKDGTLQVNGKTYGKGKGKAEVKMAADGDGSITLTDWSVEGDGAEPVTLKVTWTCTDR